MTTHEIYRIELLLSKIHREKIYYIGEAKRTNDKTLPAKEEEIEFIRENCLHYQTRMHVCM